jgi:hypothetical protein
LVGLGSSGRTCRKISQSLEDVRLRAGSGEAAACRRSRVIVATIRLSQIMLRANRLYRTVYSMTMARDSGLL